MLYIASKGCLVGAVVLYVSRATEVAPGIAAFSAGSLLLKDALLYILRKSVLC